MAYAGKVKDGMAHIIDTKTGQTRYQLGRHKVVSVVVQGDEAVVTESDGQVMLYNLKTGSCIRHL